MLTRSQVARRLGKSLATVRRIEGILLAPTDRRGVYRFNVADVDDLVRDIARGDVSIWQELNDAAGSNLSRGTRPPVQRNDFESRETLAQSLATVEQLAKLKNEHHELLSFTQELAKLFVATSSAKQLKALPEVVLTTLIALSEG
jgi:hypothetical protein